MVHITNALYKDHAPYRSEFITYVNGHRIMRDNVQPEMTLLQFLREDLGLTGTKLGCAEGGCGACTVMLSHIDHNDKVVHRNVNACLMPLCAVANMAVTTVEGIGNTKKALHAVQERLAKAHGSQCGFCTPGIVMSMYTLLRNNSNPSVEDIEHAFDGNLCRCTGYRPIYDAFRTFAGIYKEPKSNDTGKANGCPMGADCCKNGGSGKKAPTTQANGCCDDDAAYENTVNPNRSAYTPYDPSQEPIFPPGLRRKGVLTTGLEYKGERMTWYTPTCLEEALRLKHIHPEAKMVFGNTELGVETKFKGMQYPVFIHAMHVRELNDFQEFEDGVAIGVGTTLADMERRFREIMDKNGAEKTQTLASAVEMLEWFAGNQIRNVAAIGGNIATASPISDLNPLWVASGASVTVQCHNKEPRIVPMTEFFLKYRTTALKQDDVLVSLHIPFTKKNEFVESYKQARRKDDDIAIVNSALRVRLTDSGTNDAGKPIYTVAECSMCFGGVGPISVQAKETAQWLVGQVWGREGLLEDACGRLTQEIYLPAHTPGGMAEYRMSLVTSFFFKFFISISGKIQHDIPASWKSSAERYERPVSKSAQVFKRMEPEAKTMPTPLPQPGHEILHKPTAHVSADKQTSGEALYVDDIVDVKGTLYAGIVWSKHAHAEILEVDISVAMEMDGVYDVLYAKDVPGENKQGPVIKDEELIRSKTVTSFGQFVAVVLADTHERAQLAAKKVAVEYKVLTPVLTIEEALGSENAGFSPVRCLERGNVHEAWDSCDYVIEGEARTGAQEHFYLETMASYVIPKESGELEMHVSTQAPTKTQMQAAIVAGVPANRVTCKVKRMGGGFGGKESRSVMLSSLCAMSAVVVGKPVKCMLDRDEDMISSGHRHPFLCKYKVGFNKDGRVIACHMRMWANGGYSMDLSEAVVDRAIFHCENVYRYANFRAEGQVVRTNTVSNTAFRGFGAPQAMFFAEVVMDDVVRTTGLPAMQVKQMNMYKVGEETHYCMKLQHYDADRCLVKVMEKGHYEQRCAEIAEFNRKNRFRKRGIQAVGTKFGISFTINHLNQAGALVHVYLDGSVLVTHGGTEMGQGLHTKIYAVVCNEFGISPDRVYINETATDKVPNTSPTAASASSDLNGAAVRNACLIIIERLQPYLYDENEDGTKTTRTFQDAVNRAYLDCVSLSTTGYFSTPGIGFDFIKGEGKPFHYHSYGAAMSEVEIDTLTGEVQILQTDLCMDVGQSINPAIDVGQIEGAFMQGVGLFTMEELLWSAEGRLRTVGPGMYKIPGFRDIPQTFNVHLLEESFCTRAVYRSKAVGEPPLFLAVSVHSAIKDAIAAARADEGISGRFRLDAPATCERIRLLCTDKITSHIKVGELEEGKQPWFIRP
ncbi:hypothetical protein SARC_06399 [Sphaeroforma arctica JP610]|uniref:xanthine dehydrogenase n=1 Tax=Sphaeroforma arctica JP610 TaxID=667725 RepID=A0A0L0FZ72_9EUKA|nr:hypothetical protein SARC_06399 [Sphaeroforma arctica JP610]KNC81268.1 hypothetical protein SARC_06399 [Sphaeroforma arctica JP610]|eukprot:XP_014155170.1 hypothetical protein SARC_06399 [Sphaeroforma arctica JP610]